LRGDQQWVLDDLLLRLEGVDDHRVHRDDQCDRDDAQHDPADARRQRRGPAAGLPAQQMRPQSVAFRSARPRTSVRPRPMTAVMMRRTIDWAAPKPSEEFANESFRIW